MPGRHALAATFGTPTLVVAEAALRARAREYDDELAQRWPRSRVVFASKAFPCTAVQRVMVQEGLGLDVAGGGEILTALKAGVDPALVVLHGNAKSTEELTIAVQNGIGLVVIDGPDDVDRLEAIVPSGRSQDVLVRVIPGVTANTHAHVLTGHEGSKVRPAAGRRGGVDRPHREEPESVAPMAVLSEFESNNYNGNRRIPVVFAVGGRARGVVRRETWEDLTSRDIASSARLLDCLIPGQGDPVIDGGRQSCPR